MRMEANLDVSGNEVIGTRGTRFGFGGMFFERARSAAVALKDKAGAVSEGRWNTLIIAGFLLVVGSMVCSKVIDEEAQASTKLQPLAGASAKSKWRGGMRAVQTDDVVEMEVVESASPSWNGASLRSLEGWVVDEESSAGPSGIDRPCQMLSM